MSRAQNRDGISPQLRRVQERARAHPEERFTSLAHHLSESALLEAYNGLKANAGVGIDGQSKADYGRHLSANIRDLHQRLKQGRYRASPVKRVWLDKPDGGQRPIGLPTVEDKIVQSAVGNVLNAIYECDFRGLSYGFRPERNQHQALQAAQTFLQKGQVNWVLDLDLKACFDTIEHEAQVALGLFRINAAFGDGSVREAAVLFNESDQLLEDILMGLDANGDRMLSLREALGTDFIALARSLTAGKQGADIGTDAELRVIVDGIRASVRAGVGVPAAPDSNAPPSAEFSIDELMTDPGPALDALVGAEPTCEKLFSSAFECRLPQ